MSVTFTVYHTNDIHNHRKIFSFFDGIQKDETTLIFDAGDALAGSNTVFQLTEPVLHDMSRVGYTAMAMGNREFNYIREILKLRRKEAAFPILCANCVDLQDKVNDCLPPYVIKEVAGIRIGIFGLTPMMYGEKSAWLRIFQFKFINPIQAAQKVMEELQGKTDLVILLSHSGIKTDRELPHRVPGIHLLIGGHTHAILPEPEVIENTYVFQAGSHGAYVGKITFTCNPEQGKPVEDLHYELIPVKNLKTGKK